MAKVVKLISGLLRYQELASSAYEGILNVGSTITAGTNVTLPSSGTYTDTDLVIFLNGQRLNYVEDFAYVGSPPRTQVTFTFNLVSGDIVTFRREI